jgi:hypothetical protein
VPRSRTPRAWVDRLRVDSRAAPEAAALGRAAAQRAGSPATLSFEAWAEALAYRPRPLGGYQRGASPPGADSALR